MDDALSGKDVRGRVQRYYARLAAAPECGCQPASESKCCGPAYPDELLQQVPGAADVVSLGCANPLDRAALQPGEVVLDLGSGAGLDCFLAASRVGPTGRVIGVDMTADMLEVARRRARELGLGHVEFRQGLIEELPVETASVDVVLSNCVINLSPDKPAVLREIARVLRPGGRLVVADIVSRGALAEAFRLQPDGWEACVAGALTVDEYASGLRQVGLEDVAILPADGQDLDDVPPGIPFSALITARKPGHAMPDSD